MEYLGIYPALPVAPGSEWLRSDNDPTDYATAIVALHAAKQHIAEQDQWAIGAAGVFKRNADKYYGVATCLDDDRRRGLIY